MASALSPCTLTEESSLKPNLMTYFVYARIKPLDVSQVSNVINKNNFMVTGNNITTNHTSKKNEVLESKYQFYKVFMPSTPQCQVFEEVVHPRWVEFLNGSDSLIFSYGATNSGKSFTMQGTARQPGIIPRALFATFKTIEPQRDENCTLIPLFSCQAFCPSEEEIALYHAEKRHVLAKVATAHHDSLDMSILALPTPDMTEILSDMQLEPLNLQRGLVYSVWISFVEVYNEKVFDLLAPEQGSLEANLKLKHDDEDMSYYPEGVRHHLASTWEEGYDLYRYGMKNLHIASTNLNRKSSRSHCIFTIKLLTRPPNSENTYNSVSSFSICDLAGTERMAHAEHGGATRVRELRNINTSLLALNRCFVMLQSAQKRPTQEPIVPPYRESKLTLLFSKFLMGKGKLSMIANISQEPSMFFQTEQVLKMTSIAHETRVKVKLDAGPKKARKMRFSIAYSSNICATSTPLAPTQHLHVQDNHHRQKIEELQKENAALRQVADELRAENAALLGKLEEAQSRMESLRSFHEEQMEELDQRLHAESSCAARATHGVRELEEKLRKKTREFGEMQFKWHDRLTAAVQKRDQLVAHIQVHFGLEDISDPVMVVKKACFLYKDMKAAAEEEIEGFKDEIVSLKDTLTKRDDEISLLKGEIRNLKEREAFLEEYHAQMSKRKEEELQQQAARVDVPRTAPRVKSHLDMSWVSDEENSPWQLRQAKTTVRKKRRVRRERHPPTIQVIGTSDDSPATRKAVPRRLLPRDKDHLGDDFAALDVSGPEQQPSPNTIMKSTLRSGRQRV